MTNKCLWVLAGMLAGAPGSLFAAFPLVVDDAGVFGVGEGEVVVSGDGVRAADEESIAAGLSFSTGVLPRVEAGLGLGYGAVRGRGEEASGRAGLLDAGVGVKVSVVPEASAPVGLTLSGGVKLPTASARHGLGTGLTDASLLGIATKTWGAVSLDVNAGFLWTAVGRRALQDGDAWTAGAAVRWEATSRVMLFGEVFGTLPAQEAGPAAGEVRGGAQVEVWSKCYLSVALGTGLGHGAPHLHATTGLTFAF